MELLAVKPIVVEQGGDRGGLQGFGLHPKDVVTVLQVEIPSVPLTGQPVQHGSELPDLGTGQYRGFEHIDFHRPQVQRS